MGHRFDQRHAVFRPVDLALEQRQEAIGGGLRLAQVIQKAGKGGFVILFHLAQAQGQAGKGQLVARQDKVAILGMGG